jgi:putative metallohydrolase (TIGR04338 family)
MVFNLDATLESSDWIKTRSWDLPTDPEAFLNAIGGVTELEKFMHLPSAKAMPNDLKVALSGLDVTKHLAGRHDQSTHGNGSDPSIRRMNAGNGLSARQIFDNQKNQGDSQQRKLYIAQERYSPEIVRVLPQPIAPKRADFPDFENYSAAWKNYEKDWDNWARETSRNVVSELGQKHLDGTNKGIQKYFDEVTQSEWFVDKFGDEQPLGKPKFSLVSVNGYNGQYSYGFKNGALFSTFKINKGMAQHESTILHEIAHYATAISATNPFESHGKEFAGNLIALTQQVMGDQSAKSLESEFVKDGVKIAN